MTQRDLILVGIGLVLGGAGGASLSGLRGPEDQVAVRAALDASTHIRCTTQPAQTGAGVAFEQVVCGRLALSYAQSLALTEQVVDGIVMISHEQAAALDIDYDDAAAGGAFVAPELPSLGD